MEESIIAANDLLKQLRDYFLRITENAPKLKSYVWERKVTFGADAALREEASSHSNAVLLADALFTGKLGVLAAPLSTRSRTVCCRETLLRTLAAASHTLPVHTPRLNTSARQCCICIQVTRI